MLYVQKDLSAVTKAVFDSWDTRKDELNHVYLYVANARVTPQEIIASVKKRQFSFSSFYDPLLLLTRVAQSQARTGSTSSCQRQAWRIATSCSSSITRWACTALRSFLTRTSSSLACRCTILMILCERTWHLILGFGFCDALLSSIDQCLECH